MRLYAWFHGSQCSHLLGSPVAYVFPFHTLEDLLVLHSRVLGQLDFSFQGRRWQMSGSYSCEVHVSLCVTQAHHLPDRQTPQCRTLLRAEAWTVWTFQVKCSASF